MSSESEDICQQEDNSIMEKVRINISKFRTFLDNAFEITERGSTIRSEVFYGYINFISCLYVLPVIPNQLAAAGYNKDSSIEATALACGIGCIISSYITNLPFIIAPPTAVSIYLAVALQQNGMTQSQGDSAVILSGCALLLIGIVKPLSTFVTKLIPECIQASTAVGIGLITALAGLIELELVVTGKYTILELGLISPAIVIAVTGTIIIGISMHFHLKGAFMLALTFGTFTWWWYANQWPDALFDYPHFELNMHFSFGAKVFFLLLNLIFLYILTLNGIARSLSDLAGLTNFDFSIPRGNWLFIVCGFTTILSGYFSGPPILVSPESAAGIKAGAKTGLSTLVCGIFFLFSMFFCPILSHVPPSGTSPLLIVVGMMLFVNTSRIKWAEPTEAIPAFFVLLLIPFTYSILSGVGFGYILYITMCLCSGQLYSKVTQTFASLINGGETSYQTILPITAAMLAKKEKAMSVDQNLHQMQSYNTIPTGMHNDTAQMDEEVLQAARDMEDFAAATQSLSPGRPSMGRVSSGGHSQRLSLGTRPRTGSILDRVPMDMESAIRSMQA